MSLHLPTFIRIDFNCAETQSIACAAAKSSGNLRNILHAVNLGVPLECALHTLAQ